MVANKHGSSRECSREKVRNPRLLRKIMPELLISIGEVGSFFELELRELSRLGSVDKTGVLQIVHAERGFWDV